MKFFGFLPGIYFAVLAIATAAPTPGGEPSARMAYAQRVELVRQTPGLVAFWDFMLRENGDPGRFIAHTAEGDAHRYVLVPRNISREFWHEGAEATLADFPLLGRGPFGQAVQFCSPKDLTDLPVLMVPRPALHDTPLDIKGPGKSVSMVVWLIHQTGDHAIAGIWHEGTDSPPHGKPAVVRERGQRQFGLFAGLAANPGASSAHISENGVGSFGDCYARHLAATSEKLRNVKAGASPEQLDAGWSTVGFVYDNARKTVTAYLDGRATEYWINEPATNSFYRFAVNAWRQARLAGIPGAPPGKDPNFPRDQFYAPPETIPLKEEVVADTAAERVVLRSYEFTKVRVTYRKEAAGKLTETGADLAALKANPYWFGHDIYSPPSSSEGGPFTIGRVIHSNRHATFIGYIGGVAVFDQPLTSGQMQSLSRIGMAGEMSGPAILKQADIAAPR